MLPYCHSFNVVFRSQSHRKPAFCSNPAKSEEPPAIDIFGAVSLRNSSHTRLPQNKLFYRVTTNVLSNVLHSRHTKEFHDLKISICAFMGLVAIISSVEEGHRAQSLDSAQHFASILPCLSLTVKTKEQQCSELFWAQVSQVRHLPGALKGLFKGSNSWPGQYSRPQRVSCFSWTAHVL